MIRTFLNAKIHGAICTEVDLNYEGSILIDEDWIDEVGLLVHEQVDVYNKTNGNRHTTYVLPLPRGSNAVSVNGAGAHLTEVGDELIICSYIQYDENNETLYMLELNTQPGMTQTSLSPEQADYCGININDVIKILLEEASYEC